jgi:hypothetical protein
MYKNIRGNILMINIGVREVINMTQFEMKNYLFIFSEGAWGRG